MKVIDMHCDTFFEILLAQDRGEKLGLRASGRQIDLGKMKRGDYLLQNFAMFVPLDRVDDPADTVYRMIDIFHNETAANADLVGEVRSYADIERNLRDGKLSAMLTVEEGGACRGKLYNLRNLYRLGVRMMTLTWNFENELAWPNTAAKLPGYDPAKKYGLKDKGFEFVAEMEKLGMILDVSHLSDDGFWDVCRVSTRPFVASHSDARALASHPRNLTDDMIRALADRGGVTGINYCSYFLEDGSKFSRCETMVKHMRHIADVGGIGCVGLGSDFDGIDNGVEMGDCSGLPMLADEMRRQGFTEVEIEDVFYKNVLRVYQEVLK